MLCWSSSREEIYRREVREENQRKRTVNARHQILIHSCISEILCPSRGATPITFQRTAAAIGSLLTYRRAGMPREFIQELQEIAFEIYILGRYWQDINDPQEGHLLRAARRGGR